MGAADLSSMYRSALTRIGSHRIVEIHQSMAGRLWSKLSNRGDCAFRLRQLFRKHDLANSGRISIENFRVATEEFGMQLDDDALLALFSQYDTQCTGYIPYHQLMQNLLDKDDYLKYAAGQ
ncbi:hypothetical protein H632_c1653p0 [Helicosporidium sp. ATCC 50920]|nr:hypothetical protein H632_c1653p0 [Helicosporidium sp. ATCC 50920]|eukprot:KDD74011.1 hypothetical protein H632_c1653p0 [Helicosporidium sp. ATCC 50920]